MKGNPEQFSNAGENAQDPDVNEKRLEELDQIRDPVEAIQNKIKGGLPLDELSPEEQALLERHETLRKEIGFLREE